MSRDLFILGCGRSGTSLVAGLFRASGYFQGTKFYKPRYSNPVGFFEDAEVNGINEKLLSPFVPERRLHGSIEYGADSPAAGQHWLARIPLGLEIASASGADIGMSAILANRPFCLKDPRFCYTLHLWRNHAPNARMICVFRRPQVVVASILREIASMPYLNNFAMSISEAFEVWRLMYSHVLQRHALTGDWLFVDYSDLFNSSVLDRISEFSQATIDRTLPDPMLDRSNEVLATDSRAGELYDALRLRSAAVPSR